MMGLQETVRPPFPEHSRSGDKRVECTAPGCHQLTTGRKPYCLDHLDNLPYVHWLKTELERRRSGAATGSMDAVADIVEHLEVHGAVTLGALAREVQMPMKRLDSCVAKLQKAGLVEKDTLAKKRGRRVCVVRLVRHAQPAARVAG
jgi:hypothetical protein